MRTIVRIANKFIEGGLMNFIHEIKSPKVIFHSNSLKKISEELDVTNYAKKINPKVIVVKKGDILNLIHSCEFLITIDLSTTLLEAQILKKPTLSILIKNYNIKSNLKLYRFYL